MTYIFTAVLAFSIGYLIGVARAHIVNQQYLDQVDAQMRKYKEKDT